MRREKNSESRFRDFAELGADLFWEVDTEMRYTHIFGRYEEIMGKSRTDLVGQNRLEMLDSSDAESYQEHLATIKISSGSTITRCPTPGRTAMWSFYRARVNPFLMSRKISPVIVVSHAISPRAHHLSQTLKYQSTHDMLTDLTNRRELERRVKRALDQTSRADEGHVLCFMDLDQFKVVNDTCGHTAGDELLRLRGFFRERDEMLYAVVALSGLTLVTIDFVSLR